MHWFLVKLCVQMQCVQSAERYFRVVGEALIAMSTNEKGTDWCKNLSIIQWIINSSRQRITGKTPQQLLFGYEPRNNMGNALIGAILDSETNNSKEENDVTTSIA